MKPTISAQLQVTRAQLSGSRAMLAAAASNTELVTAWLAEVRRLEELAAKLEGMAEREAGRMTGQTAASTAA